MVSLTECRYVVMIQISNLNTSQNIDNFVLGRSKLIIRFALHDEIGQGQRFFFAKKVGCGAISITIMNLYAFVCLKIMWSAAS